MTALEAARLLELPADFTAEQLDARFHDLRSRLEDKIAKAPTPGLQFKYRATLAEVTRAHEILALSADGSHLPILQQSAPASSAPAAPAGASRAAPPPVQSASSAPQSKPAKGGREFMLVVVIVVALLGGGAWWVHKTRAEAAEKARLEQVAKAEAERMAAEQKQREAEEKARQESEFARLKAAQAEAKIRWDSLEREMPAAERRLSEIKSDARNTRDLAPLAVRELQDQVTANDDYVAWLRTFIARHPAKRQLARLEAFLGTKALDEAAAVAAELNAGLVQAEQELADNKRRLLSTTALVTIDSNLPKLRYSYTDSYGRSREGETPFTGALPIGMLQVRVKAPAGWTDHEQSVRVRGGEPLKVQALFPQGVVTLTSRPSGLKFTLTGDHGFKLSGTTPATLEAVPVGQPVLTMQRYGWEVQAGRITVEADKPTEVNAVFTEGSLEVVSSPPGAEVVVTNEHGLNQKLTTPATLPAVSVGPHTVTVRRTGWAEQVAKVEIEEGKTLRHDVAFPAGGVSVVSAPAGLSFEITNVFGYKRTGTTPLVLDEVPAGKATLKMQRAGWPVMQRELTIADGQKAEVNIPYNGATLTLTTTPAGAEVFQGKTKIGTTPLELKDIAPGARALSLKKDGYFTEEIPVNLAGGEVKAIAKELRSTEVTVYIYRPMRFKGAAESLAIHVNDTLAAKLWGGRYLRLQLPPSQLLIGVAFSWGAFTEPFMRKGFNLTPGSTHYFLVSHTELEEVDEATGKAAVEKSKEAESLLSKAASP